jgi:hypothetical protein
VPTVYQLPEFTAAGGLASYGGFDDGQPSTVRQQARAGLAQELRFP